MHENGCRRIRNYLIGHLLAITLTMGEIGSVSDPLSRKWDSSHSPGYWLSMRIKTHPNRVTIRKAVSSHDCKLILKVIGRFDTG